MSLITDYAKGAQQIAVLERYFSTGGELGQEAARTQASFQGTFNAAMTSLIEVGADSLSVRQAFARADIWSKTLAPPSLFPALVTRPSLQLMMLDGLYKAATGGIWGIAEPAGLTEWLSSATSARYVLEATLSDPPRKYDDGITVELSPEVIAALLRLLAEVALPAEWLAPFAQSDVFARIEVRAGSAAWATATRRVVLALNAKAKARITTDLAQLALKGSASWPVFQTGDGRATATIPGPGRPWYRRGWIWLGGTIGVVGGALVARSGVERRISP